MITIIHKYRTQLVAFTSKQVSQIVIVICTQHNGIIDFCTFTGKPCYHIRINFLQRRKVNTIVLLILFFSY